MNPFQGKVRVRACGILIENQRILLVKHRGLGAQGYFWSPPGGGMEFGENNLVETFKEKPVGDGNWINGGFFVLEPCVLDHIDGDDSIWEQLGVGISAEALISQTHITSGC